MTKFACLVYVDEAAVAALSPEARTRLSDDSIAFDNDLAARGHLILAQPLQQPHTAVTVRVKQGRMSSTDGPFAETKEHLGGFFLIEAPDIEAAVTIAAASPMATVGCIEVRPFGQHHQRDKK